MWLMNGLNTRASSPLLASPAWLVVP